MTKLFLATLCTLLPLLSKAAPSPTPDHPFEEKRDQTGGVNILGYTQVGDAGISAQMMFLGTKNKVYILDKTENNPITIKGKYGTHPAWAVEYDVNNNTCES